MNDVLRQAEDRRVLDASPWYVLARGLYKNVRFRCWVGKSGAEMGCCAYDDG